MHKVWLTLLKIKFKSRYFHAGNHHFKNQPSTIFGSDNVEVVLTGDTFDHCLEEALTYTKEHEMNFIDPFNNVYTISGQGTLAKEIVEQSKEDGVKFDFYSLLLAVEA